MLLSQFLTHTISNFNLVKERLDTKTKEGKEYNNLLTEKIKSFSLIINILNKLTKHGKDQDKYSKKYNEMKQHLESKMADAWHQIYAITESNPDKNKLNSDYKPEPLDFKKIADSTLQDWKDNFNPKKDNKVEDGIMPMKFPLMILIKMAKPLQKNIVSKKAIF